MAKKFIKTMYITSRNYKGEAIPEKVDIYETEHYYVRVYTYITGETEEQRDNKKYFWAKKCLETEFNQALCDEFQRQSKEYKEKANYNLQQNTAKKEAEHRMQVFTGALITEFGKFIGDWVKFNSKLHRKTEEIYQDFLKFMEENSK